MRDHIPVLDLGDLQEGQHQHDELAHRDILALSIERRLTHFTLHFAKYSAALLVALRNANHGSLTKIVTDSLIIALASANSLGINLERALKEFSGSSKAARDDLHVLRYVEVVGQMAKACEAFDHPYERYPSFDVLKYAVTELTALTLLCATSEGIDIASSIAERWQVVEAKARAAAEASSNNRRSTISAAA